MKLDLGKRGEYLLRTYNYPDDYINKIICGDCLEVMKGIPDNSIDLVLTDPPFNCGKEFANDDMPKNEFLQWLSPIYKEIYRTMKENTAILTECSKNYLPDILDLLGQNFN